MATQPKDFSERLKGETAETAKKLKEQTAEKAESVKEAAAQAGRQAVAKIDEQREPSARALERTANVLRETTFPGGEKIAGVAQSTADRMQATADYVRNKDLGAMLRDVGNFIRRYPAQTLAAAAVAGILVGLTFRKD